MSSAEEFRSIQLLYNCIFVYTIYGLCCPTDLHNRVCSHFLISRQGKNKIHTNIFAHAT